MTPIVALSIDGVPRTSFTYSEVAEMNAISVWQVKHLVGTGQLDVVRFGDRAPRITADALVSFMHRDSAVMEVAS